MYALIAGFVCLFALLFLSSSFISASTQKIATAIRTFVAVFSGLASTGLLMAGRYGFALMTIIAMVAAIRSIFQPASFAHGHDGLGDDASTSGVETQWLDMVLNQETGEVEGYAKMGRFKGCRLSQLARQELIELATELYEHDSNAFRLIETYLDRLHPDWRDDISHEEFNGPGKDDFSGIMDEEKALSILGLAKGAGKEAIQQAHRKLMLATHPDHGGSEYLATQINLARDFLLKNDTK